MTVPAPEVGLVISYNYLWHHEYLRGEEEGRKNRPAVIVLAVGRESDGATMVTVLPITHRAPAIPGTAVEMPRQVKAFLGLDGDPSWVVIDEGNEFLWPGYDLRKVPGAGGFDYGFLPPRFFDRVVAAFTVRHQAGRAKRTPRD